MIGRLFRSAVGLALATAIVMAPVAPAYGQSSGGQQASQNTGLTQAAPAYRLPVSDQDYSRGRSRSEERRVGKECRL